MLTIVGDEVEVHRAVDVELLVRARWPKTVNLMVHSSGTITDSRWGEPPDDWRCCAAPGGWSPAGLDVGGLAREFAAPPTG